MPPRISPELRALIAELLKSLVAEQGKTYSDVQDALREKGFKASAPTIGKEAYHLGIVPKPGRRKDALVSDGTKGGRPPGPGKKFSPYRKDARKLRAKGMSTGSIAAKLGISRQAVERLLTDDTPK